MLPQCQIVKSGVSAHTPLPNTRIAPLSTTLHRGAPLASAHAPAPQGPSCNQRSSGGAAGRESQTGTASDRHSLRSRPLPSEPGQLLLLPPVAGSSAPPPLPQGLPASSRAWRRRGGLAPWSRRPRRCLRLRLGRLAPRARSSAEPRALSGSLGTTATFAPANARAQGPTCCEGRLLRLPCRLPCRLPPEPSRDQPNQRWPRSLPPRRRVDGPPLGVC